jgi:tripartite-type tricarboxylate transporter receptor subunit TctC
MTTFFSRHTFLKALLALCTLAGAHAQAYPDKPIRLVVPWPAGGSSDTAARLVAKHLGERLKTTVVVDNKAGASGNIGTDLVAKATADGYTLLLSSGPFSVNPSLYKKLPFDTLKDFSPIGQIANTPSVLLVPAASPIKSIQDFVQSAKNGSRPLNVASPGNGTAQHLALELLIDKAKLSVTHVPYKGGAPAVNDLLGNQVPAMVSGFPEVAPHLTAGTLRALAVTTNTRSAFLATTPTLMEVGLADAGTAGWNGLHAPAGTPTAVIQLLNRELQETLRTPEVQSQLSRLGFEVKPTSTTDFSSFVTDQITRWKRAVELSGAQVD